MKQLILINIILASLTLSAHAATISIGTIDNINVADMFMGSSNNADCSTSKTIDNCDFLNYTGSLLTDAELGPAVTSNAADYVYRSSTGNQASFDLGFNGFDLYSGAGNDLVIFIVGNSTTFGLDVFDTDNNKISSADYNVTIDNTVYDSAGNWLCAGCDDNIIGNDYALSAIFVDFGDNVAGDVIIDRLHISLKNSAFSLAGGFHTEATVVPLPLSAVLFSSGLALLGWAGHRRTA